MIMWVNVSDILLLRPTWNILECMMLIVWFKMFKCYWNLLTLSSNFFIYSDNDSQDAL